MATLEEVRVAIAAELSSCDERVTGLISAATRLSEKEIVAIGSKIAELNQEALGNLDTLTGLSGAFQSGNVEGRASLDAAVRGQETTLATFVSSLNDGLSRQRDATVGIVEVARKIQSFVGGISVVALDLRMLTLNAKLEAARWGSQGAAFATVAAGMRDLTTEVQHVNEQVGELAELLSSLAGRIVENEKSMKDLSQRLAEDGSQTLDDLRRAFEDTRLSTTQAVESGTQRANNLVSLSTRMLTNLQFQDRVAQTLKEVELVVSRTRSIAGDLMDSTADAEPGAIEEVVKLAKARAGSAVVRMSGESELQPSDMSMQSGVVELF